MRIYQFSLKMKVIQPTVIMCEVKAKRTRLNISKNFKKLISPISFSRSKILFSPKVKPSSDGQWGGPKANSSIFSGCVGEIQSGVSF